MNKYAVHYRLLESVNVVVNTAHGTKTTLTFPTDIFKPGDKLSPYESFNQAIIQGYPAPVEHGFNYEVVLLGNDWEALHFKEGTRWRLSGSSHYSSQTLDFGFQNFE